MCASSEERLGTFFRPRTVSQNTRSIGSDASAANSVISPRAEAKPQWIIINFTVAYFYNRKVQDKIYFPAKQVSKIKHNIVTAATQLAPTGWKISRQGQGQEVALQPCASTSNIDPALSSHPKRYIEIFGSRGNLDPYFRPKLARWRILNG